MSYLWYPGNRVVLPAPWKLKGRKMCFLYGRNTYNPVTQKGGGDWKCTGIKNWKRSIVDQARGDVFNLAKRRAPPFVLSRERTSISKLAGRPPGRVDPGQSAETRAFNEFIEGLNIACPGAIDFQGNRELLFRVIGGIYFWGGLRNDQGKPDRCVPVDYETAFAVFRSNGDPRLFRDMVKILKEKAQAGDRRAASAVKTIDLSPLK